MSDAKCKQIESMASQIIDTVRGLQQKAVRDVEEKMQAKIERVSERCAVIESEHIPNIIECADVRELEEMVQRGEHQVAITQFYIKEMGKLRTEGQFSEAQGLARDTTQDLREVKQAAGKGEHNEHI